MEERPLIGRVEGLLRSSSRSRTRPRASSRSRPCRRCSSSTARASSGSSGALGDAAGDERSSRTSWSRTCCCCTACTRSSVEERVREALDGVRPYLGSHGGDVELVEVRGRRGTRADAGQLRGLPGVGDDAQARDRGRGAQGGARRRARRGATRRRPRPDRPCCRSSWCARRRPRRPGRPPARCRSCPPAACCARRSPASRCCSCGCTTARRTRTDLDCPGCGSSLEGGTLAGAGLVGAELSCPGCAHRYDVVRAGRCLDAPELHLEPVPLLVDDAGLIRVAVQAGVAA